MHCWCQTIFFNMSMIFWFFVAWWSKVELQKFHGYMRNIGLYYPCCPQQSPILPQSLLYFKEMWGRMIKILFFQKFKSRAFKRTISRVLKGLVSDFMQSQNFCWKCVDSKSQTRSESWYYLKYPDPSSQNREDCPPPESNFTRRNFIFFDTIFFWGFFCVLWGFQKIFKSWIGSLLHILSGFEFQKHPKKRKRLPPPLFSWSQSDKEGRSNVTEVVI